MVLLNRDLAHPFLDGLMVAVTVGAMPLLVVGPLFLLLAGKRREGFALLVTVAVSTLLAVGIQFAVMRPRPADIRAVQAASAFPSFPSGHAAAAFGGAMLVSLLWRRAGPFALLGAVLVSFSYLGQHYPSDVLGGALLGVAVAAPVYGCCWPADGARPRWPWLLWSQVALLLLASLMAYLGLLNFGLLAFPGADKLFHFLLSGSVAFLAIGWWVGRPPGAVLTILGLLATAEESLQALSPARSFDLLDLAAALVGIALFGWLGAILCGRRTVRDKWC
jgi:undecaprenyl-diphosphatase